MLREMNPLKKKVFFFAVDLTIEDANLIFASLLRPGCCLPPDIELGEPCHFNPVGPRLSIRIVVIAILRVMLSCSLALLAESPGAFPFPQQFILLLYRLFPCYFPFFSNLRGSL